MFRLKTVFFSVLMVLFWSSCQARGVVTEIVGIDVKPPKFPKKMIYMSRGMNALISALKDDGPAEWYKGEKESEPFLSANRKRTDFEDVVWWDVTTLPGSVPVVRDGHIVGWETTTSPDDSSYYEKKMLFHDGYFLVESDRRGRRWDSFRAYGRYVVDRDGQIVCTLLKRYLSQNAVGFPPEEYCKLFLENSKITFKIVHDPDLYYHQWQMVSASSGDVLYGKEDQYTKPDMIYNNDGVELYKYDGGIKRCLSRVNVREKPSLDSEIISVLDAGRHMEIEARTTLMEEIDGINDYWYYFYYTVKDGFIPIYGYVFGGYLEEAFVPERIELTDALSGIDAQNITEADIKTMQKRLIGKDGDDTTHYSISYKKYSRLSAGVSETHRIGSFGISQKNEDVAIIIFARNLWKQDARVVGAIEKVIVYPHKTMNLYCQQVLVWADSKNEYDNITVWGLYTYPRDDFIEFEKVYYPQDVVIIDNKTGEMNLMPNRNNKYSFFTGE